MIILHVIAVLLLINILVVNYDSMVDFYYWLYKKLKKPRFSQGEFVMIDDVEFEILHISLNSKPYTYLCYSGFLDKSISFMANYYHESVIRKKTGILKELE